jgi:hypothetical protein
MEAKPMNGGRKYRFALFSLIALVCGFTAMLIIGKVTDKVFEEYVWGLFLLVGAFGGANGIEHLSSAYAVRFGGKQSSTALDKK